ncbi:MAG: xanthine dehydrogenase family protein molybdopterin-binding subunit [Candidatus Izemoplasmatales bacterium]|nr:xanthine dehydrogenase family protein molybdopterin-binding subunit [Candidatus Izemoplasmatales bacterium]
MRDISTSIPRVDAWEKASGQAKYVSDYVYPGMLYAKTFRSPIASGKILARRYPRLPEGYAIIDYRDIPGKNVVKVIMEDMPIFAETNVTYRGEPILLVVGPDKEKILEIMASIQIDYQETPAIFEWTNSINHKHFSKGDGWKPSIEAARVIEYTYKTPLQEQAYLEPQGFVGTYDAGKISVIGSIQCPYYVKNALLFALGLPSVKIQVIQATVGGAFGGKEEFPSLMACQLAVALLKVKKPIKLVYEREEDILVTTKRHPATIKMQAAIDDNDHISSLKVHIGIDAGATTGLSGVVLMRAMIAATGAYTIDHLDVSGDVYWTNQVPNGAFRGFGAPQMMFAIEMFMEHIAQDLKQDPFQFRLRYLAKMGDRTSTNGSFRDPILLSEMIEQAMKISDYHTKAARFHTLKYHGIGWSVFLHGCGFTGSGEALTIKARIRLEKDNQDQVTIRVAAVDMGQGIRTTLRKLVSQILEIPLSQVDFDLPDTDLVPDSGPTVASRTMMIVGGLVAKAAEKMKANWLSGKAIAYEEQYVQPPEIHWDEDKMQGDAYPAYSWGVNIVEVQVDPVTYEVTLMGIWSVYDCGKDIDRLIVTGQADGGIAQGVGYGYLEVMDTYNGSIRQHNLTDYIIPSAADMPSMWTQWVDNPYAYGPYGAKGVGELTLVGGAPAVAKAIEMAIQHKITQIPVTPERIREWMKSG